MAVDEILVNGGGHVWVERFGALEPRDPIPVDVVPIILERVLAPLGRRLDRTSPIVDARLPDGSRICAAIPPVSVDGPVLSIRRFRRSGLDLCAFAETDVADLVAGLMRSRCNLVVSGATSSGKTSLLGAMLRCGAQADRVVLIEDIAELDARCDHVVRLEARPSSPDGLAAITAEQLVRAAMRLRPDRLVVGEVRGDEVIALMQAMNTGHDGALSTVHANNARDAVRRLETLVLRAAPTWPLEAIRSQLTRSIDAIVHVERRPNGERRIVTVAELLVDDRDAGVRPLVLDAAVVAQPERGRCS